MGTDAPAYGEEFDTLGGGGAQCAAVLGIDVLCRLDDVAIRALDHEEQCGPGALAL